MKTFDNARGDVEGSRTAAATTVEFQMEEEDTLTQSESMVYKQ